MGGGLLQLVAYGAQDVYLTGNPQITFFKVVYRRHTNFSLESIQQTFNGTVGFDKRVTAQISRNGDLIHKMYIEATVTGGDVYAPYLGQRLIKQVELEIGGQLIDRQYSQWMHVWNELALPSGKKDGYNKMVGSGSTGVPNGVTYISETKLYIPLEFWFCRNVGLALPLIALQYHEVKINVTFESAAKCSTGTPTLDASLYVDYIFLDTDERRRFAQMSHEYLIEQVQFTGTESMTASSSKKIKLNFNHPVKEIVWVNVASDAVADWNTFVPTGTGKLQLNGNDRFAERDSTYFSLVQPYQHHENIPDGKNINVYSFGLKPEEHQPSGTLNMSRIDTATLHLGNADTNSDDGQLWVFAVNYNVLRILSGMGGLAYSN
jgi:hypothetical protein